ncbi:MAG: hypothetical protein K6G55_08525 [Selenomonadaceae bacterium]|nr:hypothetical protein [Selenomonadaceae bacterium]
MQLTDLLDKIIGKNDSAQPEQKVHQVQQDSSTLHDRDIISNSLLFDSEWYCKTYGFGEYLDAANHYSNIGWRENKNPSAFFSTEDYLTKNPDVKDADMNPLVHFERFGFKEKRYAEEINRVLPEILARHPECTTTLNNGLLRVRITNACNAKCRYCGVRCSFGDEVNHAMNPDWFYNLCRPIYDNIGIILITGGDAFFAKESYNYMKFLSEEYPQITVMTESNGIAFNDKFQNLAADNLFKTHFSLNASTPEVFAAGCWDLDDGDTAKKMFPIILRNLRNYLKKLSDKNMLCFAPDLSMVINKDNADDILNFVDLALDLHAGFIVFYFDYTENDMNADTFANPEITRPAMKTLMELERVLAEKVLIYFRLWMPAAEAEKLQQEVEAIPIDELRRKYAALLSKAEGRSIIKEFEERNEYRRAAGKTELAMVDDISPSLHLTKVEDRDICFAPWNEIDLYPDGRIDFCGWFEPTLNINDFIEKDDSGNDFVDWNKLLNSFEYASARYRILRDDFRGCQVCCPMNSVKSPVEAVTKYNVDRKKRSR